MEPLLRAARVEDSPRVADILIGTRAQFMPYAPPAHTEPEVRAWVASHLVPCGGVVIAELEGQVLGVIATAIEDGTSWITQMAVDPSKVGTGIGSALLAHATKALPLPIRLYTFRQNIGPRRFYERNGFKVVQFSDGQDSEETCPDLLYELCVRTEV